MLFLISHERKFHTRGEGRRARVPVRFANARRGGMSLRYIHLSISRICNETCMYRSKRTKVHLHVVTWLDGL